VLFFVWHQVLTGACSSPSPSDHTVAKLWRSDLASYLNQLWWFPLEIALRFVPASVLVAYFWLRREPAGQKDWRTTQRSRRRRGSHSSTFSLLAVAEYRDTLRLPLYPLAAYLIAHALWHLKPSRLLRAVGFLAAVIVVEVRCRAMGFPAYQRAYRGDYAGGGRADSTTSRAGARCTP
jgi:hypothetical protein